MCWASLCILISAAPVLTIPEVVEAPDSAVDVVVAGQGRAAGVGGKQEGSELLRGRPQRGKKRREVEGEAMMREKNSRDAFKVRFRCFRKSESVWT